MTDASAIALVRELCGALDAGRVRYCHFKSNAFLDRSRTGANDLDLLVARADETRFAEIVHSLGFKLACKPSGGLPGVLDYYGYDAGADRFVHVHAHYQLIVGDDLTKNYRIPLEEAFLETAQRDGEFPVPARELELIMLVIRLVLKHATWDAVLARRGAVPASARAELAFLQERTDHESVLGILAQRLPLVAPSVFERCLLALEPDAGAIAGARAGRGLLRGLRPCARRPRSHDVALKLWRRAAGIARRVVARPTQRKRLVAGGAVVALVGADGAGKTTAANALGEWLGARFAVTRAHLGRPPYSRSTRLLTAVARGRSGFRRLTGRPLPARSVQRAVLATALARDRYLAALRIRRIATNGGLVICDRYPLPQLTRMDAPRVEQVTRPDRRRGLGRRLAALEQGYYQRIAPPDVLVVLRVDPETAVARKPDEAADFVRERWREIWEIDWPAVPAHLVDAGLPAPEVLASLKVLVWSAL